MEQHVFSTSINFIKRDGGRRGYQFLGGTSVFLWFQDALDILQGHGMVEYLKFALVHLILLLNKQMKLYLKILVRKKKMITKISFLTSRSRTSEIFLPFPYSMVWFVHPQLVFNFLVVLTISGYVWLLRPCSYHFQFVSI